MTKTAAGTSGQDHSGYLLGAILLTAMLVAVCFAGFTGVAAAGALVGLLVVADAIAEARGQ